MRLVLFDLAGDIRRNFHPLTLNRPIWELRCGMTSLGEKLVAKVGATDVACFVPEYMAGAYRAKTRWPVNDPKSLAGDDLLLVDPRVKADSFNVSPTGPSEVAVGDDGQVLYARVARTALGALRTDDIGKFLSAAQAHLPKVKAPLPKWEYIWHLMLANPEQLVADFAAAGRGGIEGTVEEPGAIRGSKRDVYIAPGAQVHPMVVIDATQGPVYIDEGAVVYPFTRIVGPCYIGKQTRLLGAKCHEGNSIGPVCRIGGEVECSIIQGYTNKYHDGFLGHAYVGEWVNLGALTTNSDLKNDYSSVSVIMHGRLPIDTGSNKVGSLIGDHTKTSIGTFLNTGAYVGAMCLIMATGKPMQKFIPSFAWLLEGVVTKGFGKGQLYKTARIVMGRRGCKWTPAEEAMWDAVFEMTRARREELIKKGRRAMQKL
jgi:UDP-N-acetylglucosamine diphosphorylase/glucosamine-1-phosphate N-acetyltransferase